MKKIYFLVYFLCGSLIITYAQNNIQDKKVNDTIYFTGTGKNYNNVIASIKDENKANLIDNKSFQTTTLNNLYKYNTNEHVSTNLYNVNDLLNINTLFAHLGQDITYFGRIREVNKNTLVFYSKNNAENLKVIIETGIKMDYSVNEYVFIKGLLQIINDIPSIIVSNADQIGKQNTKRHYEAILQ